MSAKLQLPNYNDVEGVILMDPTSGLPVSSNRSGYGYTNTITRPSNATPLTALDVIGDTNGSAIFEIPNIGVAGSLVRLLTANLIIAVSSVPSGMTTFQMWLFNASPTAHADNAALALAAGATLIGVAINEKRIARKLENGLRE